MILAVLFLSILIGIIGILAAYPLAAPLVFDNSWMFYIYTTAFLGGAFLFFTFIILLFIQIFSSQKKPLQSYRGIILFSLTAVFFIIAYAGVADGIRQFKAEEQTVVHDIIQTGHFRENMVLKSVSYEAAGIQDRHINIFWNNLSVTDNQIILKNIRLHIAQSPDEDIHLFKSFSSRGKNKEAALKNIENINYQYELKGDTLLFHDYILFEKGKSLFRNQQIEITLYIPENMPFILDNMNHIIQKKPRYKDDTDEVFFNEKFIWKIEHGYLVRQEALY